MWVDAEGLDNILKMQGEVPECLPGSQTVLLHGAENLVVAIDEVGPDVCKGDFEVARELVDEISDFYAIGVAVRGRASFGAVDALLEVEEVLGSPIADGRDLFRRSQTFASSEGIRERGLNTALCGVGDMRSHVVHKGVHPLVHVVDAQVERAEPLIETDLEEDRKLPRLVAKLLDEGGDTRLSPDIGGEARRELVDVSRLRDGGFQELRR
jgi:hypothetical protein